MPVKIPQVVTTNSEFNRFQTQMGKSLQPILSSPLNAGLLLTDIALANGDTVINHKLGRKMQGWIISDVTGGANIFRSAPLSDVTLTLNSSAAVTVSLWVF